MGLSNINDVENSAKPSVEVDSAMSSSGIVEEAVANTFVDSEEYKPIKNTTPESKDQSNENDEADLVSDNVADSINTTARNKSPYSNKISKNTKKKKKNQIWQTVMIAIGLVLLGLVFVIGGLSQLYKGKVLPGVSVAGIEARSLSKDALASQIKSRSNEMKITLETKEVKLEPKLEEIGYRINIDRTVENSINAKRDTALGRFLFWQKQNVPAVVEINSTLLVQYVENKLPSLTKAGEDARLEYNAKTESFVVTSHKDGTGPDTDKLKKQLEQSSENLSPIKVQVNTIKKSAKISKNKLQPLVAPANSLLSRDIVLSSSVGTYRAQPSDIASWITPTPQKDNTIKLVVDASKIESYVDSIGKLVSSAPIDKKVIVDKQTNKEMVMQQGRDGTGLVGKKELSSRITDAINSGKDISLPMSIEVAKFKTVSLSGYDRWIEVDLSSQTATAYESATPVKTFVIASGLPGHDTPVGEYSVWLKVRKQTMTGGSKADGSYYNIPNVEWVSYFYQDYALHGAWWREKFGAPASHGCVNMTNADAQWVYNWVSIGTKVIVHQ